MSQAGGPASLPGREPEHEDAWIRELEQQPEDVVVAAVKAAVRAGRPSLAARAVGLLAEDQQDPDLRRAQRAARLLCLARPPLVWVELDDALEQLRKRRLGRFKARHREATRPSGGLFTPSTPERRKPRR